MPRASQSEPESQPMTEPQSDFAELTESTLTSRAPPSYDATASNSKPHETSQSDEKAGKLEELPPPYPGLPSAYPAQPSAVPLGSAFPQPSVPQWNIYSPPPTSSGSAAMYPATVSPPTGDQSLPQLSQDYGGYPPPTNPAFPPTNLGFSPVIDPGYPPNST